MRKIKQRRYRAETWQKIFGAIRGKWFDGAGLLRSGADQHAESLSLVVATRRRVGSRTGRQGCTADAQVG